MTQLPHMLHFKAVQATEATARELSTIAPENPFVTPAYLRAYAQDGHELWTLGVAREDRFEAGCHAFLRQGRLGCSLAIPSIAVVPQDSPFWDGLQRFMDDHGVTDAELLSFSAFRATIPPLRGETSRMSREELVLDLRNDALQNSLSSTHKRWIKKGEKHELSLRTTTLPEAFETHIALCNSSLERRRQRGESVHGDAQEFREWARALTTGAGELCQAMHGDEVWSSIFLLRASNGAYLVSAGTSQAGRAAGASHFLVYKTALHLRDEGIHLFNLGGVRQEEMGLRQYKAGFGATPVPMESVTIESGSIIKRAIIKLARRFM